MIIFQNKSSLPLECVTTFGVSVKENQHPIGYFGTGLKYAIAVLLREDCNIEIVIDKKSYQFEKIKEEIRGKEFEFIFMHEYGEDGVLEKTIKLPFTTELGKNWQLWQAYRELWSNCKDEDGSVSWQPDEVEVVGDLVTTRIKVYGSAFETVHNIRDEFILETEPKYVLDGLEIHESDKPTIFYKGIKVQDMSTKFSYNITTDMDLTEDRTASQWDVEYKITRALLQTDNKDALFAVVSITDECYREPKFDYGKYTKPSEEFMKLVTSLKKRSVGVASVYNHYYPEFLGVIDRSILNRNVVKKLNMLRNLLSFKPKELLVSEQAEDYRVVGNAVVLNQRLLKDLKRMKFAYLVACYSMNPVNKGKSAYQIITDCMLHYFDLNIKEKQNAK